MNIIKMPGSKPFVLPAAAINVCSNTSKQFQVKYQLTSGRLLSVSRPRLDIIFKHFDLI